MTDHIGGVIDSVLAPSVVDYGFEHRSGHTKDYKIGICCFFTNYKHTDITVSRSKRKTGWLRI